MCQSTCCLVYSRELTAMASDKTYFENGTWAPPFEEVGCQGAVLMSICHGNQVHLSQSTWIEMGLLYDVLCDWGKTGALRFLRNMWPVEPDDSR